MAKVLKAFLSEKDIDLLNFRIKNKIQDYEFRQLYMDLNKDQKSIVYEYIRQRRNDLFTPAKIGHKDEPYYETEDEMMNPYPKYAWDKLSQNEIDFYNGENQN